MRLAISSGETDQGDRRFSSAAEVGMRDQRRHRGARRPVVDASAARRDLRQPALLPRAAPGLGGGDRVQHPQQPAQAARRGGPAHPGEATRGQRAAYSLTEAGIQTLPVMVAMGNWGLAHRDGTRELRVRAELLRDGGPELIERFMDELREAHLGIPLSDPDRPRSSEQLQAAYEAATTGDLDQ